MRIGTLLAALLAAMPVAGQPVTQHLDAAISAEVARFRTWSQTETLVAAVRERNATQVPLSRIRAVDMSWVGEVESNPRMQAMLKSPCTKSLQTLFGSWPGYREALVMDDQGALVCMTRKTTDYWQGDEDKWIKSFAEGRGAVHVSEPAPDESTGVTLIHVSVPIMDGGKAIGVLTVGVDHNLLRQRAKAP